MGGDDAVAGNKVHLDPRELLAFRAKLVAPHRPTQGPFDIHPIYRQVRPHIWRRLWELVSRP
ncbi:MAG: hypothetical protein HYV63_32100 [Candidatus Schekmanbacteria bacterium]|nr:hypothetical protein [Candidatus Schekmanbacteria bacterium]